MPARFAVEQRLRLPVGDVPALPHDRQREGVHAPLYRETGLASDESAQVRAALARMLSRHEPYPAVVMDRHWNVLDANRAASGFFGWLLGDRPPGTPANVIRLMFDPAGLRPFVSNWDAAADALVQRVHREAIGGVPDPETLALLDEVLSLPGVPPAWRVPDLHAVPVPVVPVAFEKSGLALSYFSTVTTLGTPQDAMLQEIRIESFFPADEATAAHAWPP